MMNAPMNQYGHAPYDKSTADAVVTRDSGWEARSVEAMQQKQESI